MGKRIGWLGVFLVLCFAALFVQLNNVQVVKAKQESNNPHNPRIEIQRYAQPHGLIEAADGTVLAQSVPSNKPGLYKYTRQYPQGGLYSQIVGYNSLIYGADGVEAFYAKDLASHNAPVKTIRDLLSTHTVTDTVRLTLQPKLQQEARTALAGRTGAVVALDPSTGAILAMYSNPTFDPNPLASLDTTVERQAWTADNTGDPAHAGLPPLLPITYRDRFAPGSAFKVITTSAAYDHAPSLVDKSYPYLSAIVPGGPYALGGQTTILQNYGGEVCGGTIRTMLPPSCDTGYSLLSAGIGSASMYAEATAFGFDQQPPIDLPHDRYEISMFPTPAQVHGAQIFLAFSSIGQKYTQASPLQMAMVAGAIADGGVTMTPHVMADVHDSQGNLVQRYVPTPWLTSTSAATAKAVNGLMQPVGSDSNGTAFGIFNPADHVAAKTGTAQVGVGNTATTDWMIAFAPADAPKIALAVVMPDQPGTQTGAGVAGPVVRSMIQAVLGQ